MFYQICLEMRKPLRTLQLLSVGICLLFSSFLKAEVIIGNLPQNNDGGSVTIGNPMSQIAFQFTMPDNDYNLDNVVLRLQNALTNGAPRISLHANDGGADPGTEITVFNNPALMDALTHYNFTPATHVVLRAGATYWILVDHTTNAASYLWYRSDPSKAATGLATFNSQRTSANDGATYGPGGLFHFSFQVNGTIVPIPTLSQWSLIILGFGLISIGIVAVKNSKVLRV